MAIAGPVVATTTAFRGIDAPEGKGVVTADNPDAFVREAVGLLKDPEHAERLGRRGRRFVERHRAWPDQLRHLDPLLEEAALSGRHQGGLHDGQGERTACA